MPIEFWIAIIAGAPGLVLGLASLFIQLKKTPHENARTDAEKVKAEAETNNIHAQTADRWAEHVGELMAEIKTLQEKIAGIQVEREQDHKELTGLRLDIAQVRRENEAYRLENVDLKDWAERLVTQLKTHAPHITPEQFIRRNAAYTQE